MEDSFPNRSLFSTFRSRKSFEEQLRRIKKASELAQDSIDYSVAHNEHVLHAIEVVEAFLRKKHRICYGGQAINAHLPEKYKIYDPERSIPDYDFFTPTPEQDIHLLVQDLKKAGFQEISAREGMHEGTVKIYVEYVPVADITVIDPPLYRILSKRELRVDGISYMDIHSLRMMMYLELSRPRGQVERWPKVYERLMLLNTFAARRPCRTATAAASIRRESSLTNEQVERILQWLVQKQRVFAGIDLIHVYEQALQRRTKHMEWLVHTRKPILFYSPTPREDIETVKELLEQRDTTTPTPYRIQLHQKKGAGEILPVLTVLYQGSTPLIYAIHQTACHSYFQLPLSTSSFTGHKHPRHLPRHLPRPRHRLSDQTLRIASIDTLITLYFSISLMNDHHLTMPSMECLANQLIHLSIQMRMRPENSPFPFISLNCSGHQASLPSLIRAKVQRLTERKAKLRQVMNTDNPRPPRPPRASSTLRKRRRTTRSY